MPGPLDRVHLPPLRRHQPLRRRHQPLPRPRIGRDKTRYKAHHLRHDIVHAFPDQSVPEMTVLTGPVALRPGEAGTFSLIFPARNTRNHPTVRARWVSKERFSAYIDPGLDAPEVPEDFDTYEELPSRGALHQEEVELTDDRPGRWKEAWARYLDADPGTHQAVTRAEYSFTAPREEGAIILEVDCGVQVEGNREVRWIEHVAVYCRAPSTFPAPGVENLSELIRDAVNLTDKNSILWFVHPIYFVEQLLQVKLAPEIKEQICCEDTPPDVPARDEDLVLFQWGARLAGYRRFRLHVDDDQDDCLDLSNQEIRTPPPFDVSKVGVV